MRTCLLLALASFTAGVAADATAADAGPTSATAADAAAPILELSIADGASLIADAQASLFGQVWNDPVMAPLRAHSATAVAVAMAEMPNGLDPMSVLTAANHVGLRMMDRPVADQGGSATQADEREDFMAFAIQGDFGASAAAVFAAIPAKASSGRPAVDPASVLGADEVKGVGDLIMARYGTVIRGITAHGNPDRAWDPGTPAHGLRFHIDLKRLFTAIDEHTRAAGANAEQNAHFMAFYSACRSLDGAARLSPAGLANTMDWQGPSVGLRPIDAAVLARIPADAVEVCAVGLDGAAFWKQCGADLLGCMDGGAAKAEQDADAQLAQLGLPALPDLVSGIKGTAAFFTTPGAPFPGVSLVIPRSPATDQAVAALLAQLKQQPPAEGASIVLTVPNLPLLPQLVLAKDGWLLTTDAQVADAWTSDPGAGAWPDSVVGKAALSHAGLDTVLIEGCDTKAELLSLVSLVSMGLGSVPDLSAQEKQAVIQGLLKLATKSSPSWNEMRTVPGGLHASGEGIALSATGIAYLAVMAAIIVPNLLESRESAQEAAAATALKSGILPAEVQFQAGAYVDEDGNGIGEFGYFSEMSGRVPVANNITLNLLAPTYQQVENGISGYHFAVFLPDGEHRAVGEPFPGKRTDDPKAAGMRERLWIAYAWPIDRKQGRQVFAINQAGNVYHSQPIDPSEAPAWNALMGGGDHGWSDGVAPAWTPYRHGLGTHHATTAQEALVNEGMAASALKAGILPAEVQFQAGAYVDDNKNGLGEYGFLSEMSGTVKVDGKWLNLLPPTYQSPVKGIVTISGFSYAVFLPDGEHRAMVEPFPGQRAGDPAAAVMREQKWIAYCWPLDGTQGKHQFAINQSGNVWTTPVADPIVAPAWNALMGGGDKGWSDDVAPEWVPYKR